MLNYLSSSSNVLAIRVRDGLTREDLDGLIERLGTMMDRNPKTHVFVDVDRLEPEYWMTAIEALPRSLGLLRLNHYGRIAIVSDDRFVRSWSRLESAILPGVHYEIFHADETQRALRWVEGKIDQPHAAALEFLETNNPLVLAYSIDGTISKTDMDKAIEALQPRLTRELGPISVLGRFGEVDFSHPTSLFNERYFRFKKDVLARVERYAIVGGPAWLQMMVKAIASFVPFELRYFKKAEEDEAWDWLGAREAKNVTNAVQPAAEMLV